jgi:hypothetical protein
LKIIIAGHRDFEDYDELLVAIANCPFEITEVVSGHAEGVDKMGERWSREVLKKEAKVFPADWTKWGKGAGPRRNTQMAQYADGLLAIFKGGQNSGTWNMIKQADLRGLEVYIHYPDPTREEIEGFMTNATPITDEERASMNKLGEELPDKLRAWKAQEEGCLVVKDERKN